MRIFEKYCNTQFASYEDFYENFKLNIPENFNFAYDVVDVLAKEKPEKCAIIWTNVAGEEKRMTFLEMKQKTDQAAQFLSTLGIERGDRVMLVLKRRIEFWIAIIALHKIGAVTVPATHLLTKKDIVYRNNAAGIKAIIAADGEIEKHIEDAEADSPTLKLKLLTGDREGWINFNRGMDAQTGEWSRVDTCATDMMVAFFSSGTTGMPKIVAHDFRYPLAHIPTAVFWHNVEENGVHLTVADSGWGKCLWGKLYGQWFAETTVFVYDFDKFDPPALLEKMQNYKVTTFCAPPTIYRYFIKEDLSKYDLSSLKYATTAGEALNPEVNDQFKAATGLDIMEGFGQTETVLSLANYIYGEKRTGSLGRPSPLFHIDVVDEEGNPCSIGETGEIVIYADARIPGLMMGYYEDEARTKEVWHDGMYHTGDTAWKDEAGYFWYVGRVDDVIKSSGYRIGPFEVESALMEHPAVLECAITGIPHPVRGQVVKATIVLAKGYTASEELKKQLQDHVKVTTAPYKYPRVVEFVEDLPKTISGKIKRKEIREQDLKKGME